MKDSNFKKQHMVIFFLELIISFLKNKKNYVYTRVSKYIIVATIYTSHIGFSNQVWDLKNQMKEDIDK